jgi:hypothetical protein
VSGTSSLTFSRSRPSRRRWWRVLVWIVVIAALVALLATLVAGGLWVYAWSRLGGTELPSLEAAAEEALVDGGATSPEGTTTVLVALTPDRERTEPGEPPLEGPVALVQVGGVRGDDAAVVVLPQQLAVGVDGEGTMPLAAVHELGGPDLLLRTVVDYTGVAVDHVVTAQVGAVPALVDALEPVEACTTTCTPVGEAEAQQRISTVVDGSAAEDIGPAFGELAALVAGAADRIDVQRAVTSPFNAKRTIDVLADRVVTDASLRGAALLPLAERLADPGAVAVAGLPGVINPETGRLLVLPEQAETRFALLRDGGVPTAGEEDETAAWLADAVVAVQNGTGTDGYAGELEARLTAAGVQVLGTENADDFGYETTVVRYGPDDQVAEAAAIVLAEELGDVQLEAADSELTFEGDPVSVVVIGGADLDDGEA